MGQYHLTVNLDKREFLYPHDLGDGLKLWEQGASSSGTLAALQMLLAVSNGRGGGDYDLPSYDPDAIRESPARFVEVRERPAVEFFGRWAGDRVVVIGDYGTPEDLLGIVKDSEDFCGGCLYERCSSAHVYPDGTFDESLGEACEHCGFIIEAGSWQNVSPILAPVLEHEFGFRFNGDGWRERVDTA